MRDRSLIGSAIAATIACGLVEISQTSAIVGHYREALPPAMFASWFAGLAVAIVAPPACGVLFWRIAPRWRRGWIAHLLPLPLSYAVFQAAAAVMLSASGEPDDDSLTGHALLPAMLLVLVCPLLHLAALVVRHVRGRGRRANALPQK